MILYSLIIHLYAFLVGLISPLHKKARLMMVGQWRTNSILRNNIDRREKYIWFHASSLGEFEQGRPLMEQIKATHPDYKILLTFFSPSGYEVRKNYDGADVVCYLPFDTPCRVRKFLDLANPAIAVFIKYEFWANYLVELKRRNIPTYIISAIFNRRQVFFKWYGKSYKNVLNCFTRLFVQDDDSRSLLAEYGVNNVDVIGDTRFDRVVDVQSQARKFPLIERFADKDGVVLVAGSSWKDDEDIFIDYFNEHSDVRLIIAPHEIHSEHLISIQSRLKRPFACLSEANETNVANKDCIIIDSFGMLSSIYRYGDIAYIGGGFGAGIHNVLEAAVYGIPVIFGPKYDKFKEATDLLARKGAFTINDKDSFYKIMNHLRNSSDAIKSAGSNAENYVKSNTGATNNILKRISL